MSSPIKLFNELINDYVEIPSEPRIVSLAPSITDILYQIGAWKYVYGVSVYCDYPPEAKNKPKAGTYTKAIYSILYEINPNLILTTTGVQRALTYELKNKGFNVFPTQVPSSLYGIFENIIIIGVLLNMMENAYNVIDRCNKLLNDIKNKFSATVYFEVDLGGPVTIGSAAYITSALHHLGLKNIFMNIQKAYFEPEFDVVARANPDLIIYELGYSGKQVHEGIIEMLNKRGWSNLDAVRKKKIYILPPNTLTHYGPLLFDNLKKVCEVIGREE